jgi:predicted neutral ceramidase superfamily lipid hydrolase
MSTHEKAFRTHTHWLTWLGLLPFLAGALLILSGQNEGMVIEGLRNYGAIILTFVGAIHWGRALQMKRPRLATLSIWPSIYAWLCLFLPVETGLLVLALGFLLVLIVDLYQYRSIGWFQQLRIQISFSVAGLLFFSWSFT